MARVFVRENARERQTDKLFRSMVGELALRSCLSSIDFQSMISLQVLRLLTDICLCGFTTADYFFFNYGNFLRGFVCTLTPNHAYIHPCPLCSQELSMSAQSTLESPGGNAYLVMQGRPCVRPSHTCATGWKVSLRTKKFVRLYFGVAVPLLLELLVCCPVVDLRWCLLNKNKYIAYFFLGDRNVCLNYRSGGGLYCNYVCTCSFPYFLSWLACF